MSMKRRTNRNPRKPRPKYPTAGEAREADIWFKAGMMVVATVGVLATTMG